MRVGLLSHILVFLVPAHDEMGSISYMIGERRWMSWISQDGDDLSFNGVVFKMTERMIRYFPWIINSRLPFSRLFV